MRVLLDTSFLYDLMAAYGEFSESIRGFAADHDAEFFVSTVSIWEMRLKYDAFHPSGERKSPYNPNDVLAILYEQDVTSFQSSHATPRANWRRRSRTGIRSINCSSSRLRRKDSDS